MSLSLSVFHHARSLRVHLTRTPLPRVGASGSPSSPGAEFEFYTPPATLPSTSPLALGKRAASRELNADAWIAGPWVVGQGGEQELQGAKEGECKADRAGDDAVLHQHATRAAKKARLFRLGLVALAIEGCWILLVLPDKFIRNSYHFEVYQA